MTTKIKSGVIGDNVVGITQLNVSDGTNGQVLTTDGSGTLSFADGGVDGIVSSADATAITIDSSEKVGFNKVPSTWHLDVLSSDVYVASFEGSNDTGVLINSDTDSGDIIGYSNSTSSYNALNIRGASGTGLVIDTSNRVGIGDSSPATKLEIVDANGIGLRFGDIAATPSSQTAGYIGMSTSAYSGVNGDLVLIPRTSTSSRILLMEGNVGIGITSPSGELHVDSGLAPCDIHFTTGSTGGTGYDVNLNMTGGANNSEMNLNMGIAGNADREQIKTYQSTMRFTTADTERMRIDSSGNLLVGTQSTVSSYSVATFAGDQKGITIYHNGTSPNYRSIYANSSGTLYFYNGTNEAYLSSAGAWTSVSDARLKTNIRDIEYGLNTVLSSQPRHFERNDVDGTYIGFVAQEMQELIPEVISGDSEKQLGLDYGSLVAVAFKAIQELKTELDAAKARITELEG